MQPETKKGDHVMTTHTLLNAVEKLLPHAEAEQENLRQMAKQNPDEYQAGYEDCRHAVSYAYEALRENSEAKTAINSYRDLVEALEFVSMTFADMEASERKGYLTECPKIVAAALAKAEAQ
jgi:hypothetical protein